MAILMLNLQIPDGETFQATLTLYGMAKELGYAYPERMDKYLNTQRSGMMMAVSAMLTDLALGKLKIVKK